MKNGTDDGLAENTLKQSGIERDEFILFETQSRVVKLEVTRPSHSIFQWFLAATGTEGRI